MFRRIRFAARSRFQAVGTMSGMSLCLDRPVAKVATRLLIDTALLISRRQPGEHVNERLQADCRTCRFRTSVMSRRTGFADTRFEVIEAISHIPL